MKKMIVILFILIGVFFIPANAAADSPLTSTPFSKAYYDVTIVREARDLGIMNSDFAAYLADENNPIDVKAAIINALSWDFEGKTNADTYCLLIFDKSLVELEVTSLSPDQQFCIGYLLALDDYFNTAEAMEYLQFARSSMNDSFTVAVVTYLVEAMNMEYSDWQDGLERLIAEENLHRDLSEDALQIISDYMFLGIDNPVDIPKTGVPPIEVAFVIGAGVCAIVVKLSANKNT